MKRQNTKKIAGLMAALALAAAPAASAVQFDSLPSCEAIRSQLCIRWNICLGQIGLPSVPDIEIPDTEVPELPETPEIPEVPEAPVVPEIPETPDTPDAPEVETPDASADAYAVEVVRLVNEERAKQGLSALQMDAGVTAAAQVRAREIVSTFSHTRPDGRKCFTALDEAGVRYRGAGENIAYGQPSPAAVVNAWMNSPGHRANILNANFTTIGVGHHTVGSTHYWTQFFTS